MTRFLNKNIFGIILLLIFLNFEIKNQHLHKDYILFFAYTKFQLQFYVKVKLIHCISDHGIRTK